MCPYQRALVQCFPAYYIYNMISTSQYSIRRNRALRVSWPNLTIDQKAWELAKAAAHPDETLSETIARAQQIKVALTK